MVDYIKALEAEIRADDDVIRAYRDLVWQLKEYGTFSIHRITYINCATQVLDTLISKQTEAHDKSLEAKREARKARQ